MAQAQAAVDALAREPAGGTDAARGFNLPDVGSLASGGAGLDSLADVELNVSVELGRTEMVVEDILRLTEGSVVELDKLAGDPVDVFVNQRLVARGEVLVLNDNFCIRISEIVDDLQEQAQEAATARE
jgi:flagellar motor switch protein FliN/FliY